MNHQDFEWDFVIVGSGFGGSVSALRLTEKGYKVLVIEKGKRFGPDDYAVTNWNLSRYLWLPLLRCFGIQKLTLFSNVLILSGVGVGGGSLVYANTLLEPGDEFYQSSAWSSLGDWKKELSIHYQTAKKMLGVVKNPHLTFIDHEMKAIADQLGKGDTFKPSDVGVYFGTNGKTVPDPFFNGEGPARTGCKLCGGCMVGCRHGAKNTLDKNYLYLAEKKGAKVMPETEVLNLIPDEGTGKSGWTLETCSSTAWIKSTTRNRIRAKKVVLSGGVLGTVSLLLKCKKITESLPSLSQALGLSVRTNSEALLGVTAKHASGERNYSEGVAITSVFHADEHTHIEPVRYPKGSSFMRLLTAPMVDGGPAWLRTFKMCYGIVAHPIDFCRSYLKWGWAENTVIFLVMQTLDNKMNLTLGRNLFTGFMKKMTTALDKDAPPVPSTIPIGHDVARAFAKSVDGIPASAVNEVVLNIPTTAHILGGCPIGADAKTGVIDSQHRVFGYEGLWVCDGSAIPANLGVNPSLTITAMSERAMSLIAPKG